MAYTEKVSLSGTALSFLLYECINSANSQEGFLIGEVTSEITNHISDSQSDNARLDTQIVIRTVLPLPSVSLFYSPTGRVKEDVISDILSNSAAEVVGWYKYRKNSSIKPTFRDKLISKALQKYFEKHHGKKTFVTCNLSTKTSSSGSTHTYTYRFGKINCFDMYEYIEDVTANLGEKLTGYRKGHKQSPHSIFNKIVKECNVQNNNTNDAILSIQEAVDMRLNKEAKLAAKNEHTIREISAEIKQISTILAEKLSTDLHTQYNKITEEKKLKRDVEMAEACVEALKTPFEVDILSTKTDTVNNHMYDSDSVQIIENDVNDMRSNQNLIPSDIPKPILNYAAALKNKSEIASASVCEIASTSKSNNFSEDLITFDDDEDDNCAKKTIKISDVKCIGDSSPEY